MTSLEAIGRPPLSEQCRHIINVSRVGHSTFLAKVQKRVQDALRPSRCIASCRSQSACRRIQSCGDVFRKRPRRRAVSAVMLRFPRTISFNRLSEMSRRFAASSCPTPSGLRYSSSRISPGGIAGPSQFGSLVIVLDADFVGTTALPSERDAMLLVDSYAVAADAIALQSLQAISGW